MSEKITVLIADDAIIDLEGIKAVLRGAGEIEAIATASTTEQVLEIASKMKPSVVVLDMNWFGDPSKGLTLIKALRIQTPKSAILAITGYPELLDKAKQAGAQQAISKGISRRELIQNIRSVAAKKKVILFLAADATDMSRLRLGEELREIQEKLQLASLRDKFELHQRMSVRPADISQALLDVKPHIVHFSGHGSSTGALCFETQTGKAQPVNPEALAALFEQFTALVKCVVLSACYSEDQAKATARHVNYVIGMSNVVSEKAGLAFATGFYQALGAGRTFIQAYKLGCVQIGLQGIPEHLVPVLIEKN